MCGIIGYVGSRECKALLLQGLERLEYRGYDSAGIALLEADGLDYVRAVGPLGNLKERAGGNGSVATTGLGHTRWATHGGVTEANAHPLAGCTASKLSIVLNGIVENYRELTESLVAEGHTFRSETDAETVTHLVERYYEGDLVEAVRLAFQQLEGHFAFVVIHHDHPGLLVGARHQVPLVVGVGVDEMFLASNAAAFLRETRVVQFPSDGEIVAIRPEGATYQTSEGVAVQHDVSELDWDDEGAEKAGFETFMLKEIYEQPEAVAETIGDRVRHGTLVLEGLDMTGQDVKDLRRIVLLACGTAYHACVVGRYLIEEWARVPVEFDIASEWVYRNPVISEHDLVIGITQSGETRDTIEALKLARERGARTVAITNMMGSQVTREVDSVLYTRAGLEMGVAASKTFTAQVALLYLVALKLAQIRETLPRGEIEFILDFVYKLPSKIQAVPRRGPSHRGDRAALPRRCLLPLPGPPYRTAGRARGCAEAEGDLVHPDRGVLGGGDEARADRASRRADAGRRRRHEHPRLRQDRLEHPGGPGTWRARHRDRDRRQRGHPAPRRRRDLRAEDSGLPAGRARDPPAAAPRLPDRPSSRPERRPAAEPGQDRHGRVAPRISAAPPRRVHRSSTSQSYRGLA